MIWQKSCLKYVSERFLVIEYFNVLSLRYALHSYSSFNSDNARYRWKILLLLRTLCAEIMKLRKLKINNKKLMLAIV